MTAGSAIGVAGVLLWSASTDLATLYAAFALIGLGLAMSTYEAAFAVLVAATDAAHRDTAIIVVSLVTGFAASLYYRLAGWLPVAVCVLQLLSRLAIAPLARRFTERHPGRAPWLGRIQVEPGPTQRDHNA